MYHVIVECTSNQSKLYLINSYMSQIKRRVRSKHAFSNNFCVLLAFVKHATTRKLRFMYLMPLSTHLIFLQDPSMHFQTTFTFTHAAHAQAPCNAYWMQLTSLFCQTQTAGFHQTPIPTYLGKLEHQVGMRQCHLQHQCKWLYHLQQGQTQGHMCMWPCLQVHYQ